MEDFITRATQGYSVNALIHTISQFEDIVNSVNSTTLASIIASRVVIRLQNEFKRRHNHLSTPTSVDSSSTNYPGLPFKDLRKIQH
jgi:hypothetical protein